MTGGTAEPSEGIPNTSGPRSESGVPRGCFLPDIACTKNVTSRKLLPASSGLMRPLLHYLISQSSLPSPQLSIEILLGYWDELGTVLTRGYIFHLSVPETPILFVVLAFLLLFMHNLYTICALLRVQGLHLHIKCSEARCKGVNGDAENQVFYALQRS
jgi:hypothetical protein